MFGVGGSVAGLRCPCSTGRVRRRRPDADRGIRGRDMRGAGPGGRLWDGVVDWLAGADVGEPAAVDMAELLDSVSGPPIVAVRGAVGIGIASVAAALRGFAVRQALAAVAAQARVRRDAAPAARAVHMQAPLPCRAATPHGFLFLLHSFGIYPGIFDKTHGFWFPAARRKAIFVTPRKWFTSGSWRYCPAGGHFRFGSSHRGFLGSCLSLPVFPFGQLLLFPLDLLDALFGRG